MFFLYWGLSNDLLDLGIMISILSMISILYRFEREAVDGLENEEMPLALEFSDPSNLEERNRGRPRAKGKERKKLKKQ
jgi:hypothetical protein